MKYLQTFKENFDFERQPIINLQDFLPDYHETKYWKLTRDIRKEDIDKGKQNKTKITMYWKVEKISDKNYKFTLQSVNNNNKISNSYLDENLIDIVLKINPEDNPKLTPLSPEEIEDFETNITAYKYNL